ncbi:MAG: DUF11 domain-containing protein [Candidatus Doudnabacteria bacterium]|nr:DUF11 domain-containing protein [Candidatus Doudnabacteria bacterium]
MRYVWNLGKTKVAKITGLALVAAMAVSFISMGQAEDTFQLTVNVEDDCGPVVAQIIVVNGPDDGAFGITNSQGEFTFNLRPGVFYLRVVAEGHQSKNTDPVVLDSNQSLTVTLNRTTGDCPGGGGGGGESGTIKVVKEVINDDGGTARSRDFELFIDGNRVSHNERITLDPGTYRVTENEKPGYRFVRFGEDCDSNGRITLQAGQDLTCKVVNNDLAIPPQRGTIKVVKEVINDDGGTARPRDFALFIDGRRVDHNETVTLNPGTYRVTENDKPGYRFVRFGEDCDSDGRIRLETGQNLTCRVVNGDIPNPPPPPPPGPEHGTIRVIKEVINDDGGSAKPQDFEIFLDGRQVSHNQVVTLNSGTYQVTENQRPGYRFVRFGDDCDSNGRIRLATDQNLVCKIVNGDIPPTQPGHANLTIAKTVRNVSAGQSSFAESVSVTPGQQVEFMITVSATGDISANNVVLTDTLPQNFSLNFVTFGSGVTQGNTQTSFNLGSLSPSSSKTVKLTATAASESNFPVGSSSWVNTAAAAGSNASSVSDNAIVVVERRGITIAQPSLSVSKQVRAITQSGYSESVNVNPNDRVEFRITISNGGNSTAQNVRVADSLPSGLQFVAGTLRLDNSTSFSDLFNSSLALGSMSSGSSRTITFEANASFAGSHINAATVFADNLSSVTDTASVLVSQVSGGNVDLILSKRAFNQTKNQNAIQVTATAGDLIVYTLTVENRGNSASTNFVVQDNIGDILELAELTVFEGASFDLANRRLTWPAVSIVAGGRVEKTFSVRIRSTLPASSDFVMTNVYGNRVDVNVARPQIAGVFVSPKTGSGAILSFGLAFATVVAYAVYRKNKFVLSKLIWIK